MPEAKSFGRRTRIHYFDPLSTVYSSLPSRLGAATSGIIDCASNNLRSLSVFCLGWRVTVVCDLIIST